MDIEGQPQEQQNYYIEQLKQKILSNPDNLKDETWNAKLKAIHFMTEANENETIPQMKDVVEFCQLLNSGQDWATELFPGQDKFLKYLNDDFFIELIQKTLINFKFKYSETLDLTIKIIQQALIAGTKAIPSDNPKLIEVLSKVFEFEKRFYQENNLLEEDIFFQSIASPLSLKQWQFQLQPGEVVDVLKKEHVKNNLFGWMRAKVLSTDSESIKLQYFADHPKSSTAIFKLPTIEIQPRGSKISDEDWEWRMDLQKDDEVDCVDQVMVWYRSTILARTEIKQEDGTSYISLRIGFREYWKPAEGEEEPIIKQGGIWKKDAEGRVYRGWSQTHDIDLVSTSLRIRRPGSMSKQLYTKASTAQGEDLIDDSNDEILPEQFTNDQGIVQQLYAVPRFFTKTNSNTVYMKKTNYSNSVIIDLINRFGFMGGFELVLNRISSKDNWLPFDNLAFYIQILSYISPFLRKSFCCKWVPLLKEAVWENLLKSPISNIRNFKKKSFQTIKEGLGSLLKRVYSIGQKNDLIEQLVIDVAWMCFNSSVLDKRVWGLKEITEVLKDAKNSQSNAVVDINYLKKWVEEKDLFGILYTKEDDSRLIERSGDFLKFFIDEQLLQEQDLQQIWKGTQKGIPVVKLAIYKCIQQAAMKFSESHLEFLVKRITAIPPAEVIIEDIELIHELLKLNLRYGKQFVPDCQKFFWQIISFQGEIQQEIIEKTGYRFTDLIRTQEQREQVFDDCCDNISKDQSVIPSIQIIEKILKELFNDIEIMEATNYLLNKKGLEKLITDNMKKFKQGIKAKLDQQEISLTNNPKIDQILDDLAEAKKTRCPYRDQIQLRIGLIHFVFSKQGNQIINMDQLARLWNEVVENGFSVQEKDIIYKWFCDVAGGHSNISIHDDDLKSFFIKQMCRVDSMHSMTEQGFSCFRVVFCIINQGEKRLIMRSCINDQQSAKKAQQQDDDYDQRYMGIGSHQYQTNNLLLPLQSTNPRSDLDELFLDEAPTYNNKNDSDGEGGILDNKKRTVQWDGDFVVLQDPNTFKGIKELWEIVFFNKNSQVIGLALEFLNKIYTNLSEDLEEKQQDLKHQYLKRAYEFLEMVIQNKEGEEKLERALGILQSMIDESEKQGNGGLKSLTSLVSGENLQLNFINDSFTGHGVPRIFQLKVANNMTVYELIYQVGQQIKKSYDCVGLVLISQNRSLNERDKGKTLYELKVRNQERFSVLKVEGEPVERTYLIDKAGKLNPKAEKIFKWIFSKYSKDGKMNREQCCMFIRETTNGECSVDDSRVKKTFQDYDTDKDDLLDEENFIKFYFEASRERAYVVWDNIKAHHYRPDLLRYDEIPLKQVDPRTLPRYILSRDQQFFRTIFDLLDKQGSIQNSCWELLSRLPISPDVFQKIVSLEKVRSCSKPNWEWILDSRQEYKLLYSLYIIEYLMDENRNQQQEFLLENEELHHFKNDWKRDFIVCGGFDHVWGIYQGYLNSARGRPILEQEVLSKKIFSLLLKVIRYYSLATFSVSYPQLFKTLNICLLTDVTTSTVSQFYNQYGWNDLDEQEVLAAEQNDPKMQNVAKVRESLEFLQLKECLSGALGVQIKQKYGDFDEFMRQSLDIISQVLRNQSSNLSEDRMILENLLVLAGLVLLQSEEIRARFFENVYLDWSEFFLEGIFTSKSQNIRCLFGHLFFMVCLESKRQGDYSALNLLMKQLISHMPGENTSGSLKENCSQYFDILCSLIDQQSDLESSRLQVDFFDLMRKTIRGIIHHRSTESRIHTEPDRILIGLLNLSNRLLLIKPELQEVAIEEDFVAEIFERCLFELRDFSKIPVESLQEYDQNWNKCKGEESRNAAYKLLFAICKGNAKSMRKLVNNGLIPLLERLPQTGNLGSGSSYVSSYRSAFYENKFRSPYGYAGIRNLGCICYMISMIQQLFLTPTFRYAVLAAQDLEPENWATHKGKKVDDNVFHQLQKLFGFLEYTDRQDYNPEEFCFSYKDYDGIPVKIGEQQDAHQFLVQFFDKIENALRGTPFKNILQGVYGGQLSSYMRCKRCGKTRENREAFTNITAEVVGFDDLHQSLEKFISGEDIDDFTCEYCKQKGIVKGTYFQSLPNVLIVRLQRIVFDYDTLAQIKVNSYLSFPMELDMEPYTKEGVQYREKLRYLEQNEENPDPQILKDLEAVQNPQDLHSPDYYHYKLVGVVIHIGSADWGHYYSYIDTNRDKHLFYNPDAEEKWLEFNDQMVSPFSTEELEAEAFGGSGESNNFQSGNTFSMMTPGPQEGTGWGWGGRGRESTKNAYLLVYERRQKLPITLTFNTQEELDEMLTSKGIEFKKKEEEPKPEEEEVLRPIEVEIDYYTDFSQYQNQNLVFQTWLDNQNFMMERNISANEFFIFIKEITNVLELPELTEQNCPNGYYEDYDKLSQEVQDICKQTIDILQKMIIHLLHKNINEKFINEMIVKLKKLLKVCPQYCLTFFKNSILQQPERALKNLIDNQDKQTRQFISDVMSESINITINMNRIVFDPEVIDKAFNNQGDQLDVEKHAIERQIIPFLRKMYDLFDEQLPKHWQNINQFFVFWKNLAQGGEYQIRLLYHFKVISKFLDFMLDKHSPVEGINNKSVYRLGSQYSSPDFDSLIDTVAVLCQRANTPFNRLKNEKNLELFELSLTDKKLIYASELWYLCLNNQNYNSYGYSHKSVGVMLRIFAFESMMFTEAASLAVLRGLSKVSFKESKPYFRAIMHLLAVEDQYQIQRCEILLGATNYLWKECAGMYHLGAYLIPNLDEQVLGFSTVLGIPVHQLTSFLDVILNFMRKGLDNQVIVGLRLLFESTASNPTVIRYLSRLPSPTYQFRTLIEYIGSYLEKLVQEMENPDINPYLMDKKDQTLELDKVFKAFLKKYELEQAELKLSRRELIGKVLGPEAAETYDFNHDFVIGQTVVQDDFLTKAYKVPQPEYASEHIRKLNEGERTYNKLLVTEIRLKTFVTHSKPDGKTNLAFPQEYVKENIKGNGNMIIDTSEIRADSPWTALIYTKNLLDPLKQQSLLYTENGRELVGQPIDQDTLMQIQSDSEHEKKAQEYSAELEEVRLRTQDHPLQTCVSGRVFRVRNYSSQNLLIRFHIANRDKSINSSLPTKIIQFYSRSNCQFQFWIETKINSELELDEIEWSVEFDTLYKKDKVSFDGGWIEWSNFPPNSDFEVGIFNENPADVKRNCSEPTSPDLIYE